MAETVVITDNVTRLYQDFRYISDLTVVKSATVDVSVPCRLLQIFIHELAITMKQREKKVLIKFEMK